MNFENFLRIIKTRLEILGDSDPDNNARPFVNVLNGMYGKRDYTDDEFADAYVVFKGSMAYAYADIDIDEVDKAYEDVIATAFVATNSAANAYADVDIDEVDKAYEDAYANEDEEDTAHADIDEFDDVDIDGEDMVNDDTTNHVVIVERKTTKKLEITPRRVEKIDHVAGRKKMEEEQQLLCAPEAPAPSPARVNPFSVRIGSSSFSVGSSQAPTQAPTQAPVGSSPARVNPFSCNPFSVQIGSSSFSVEPFSF